MRAIRHSQLLCLLTQDNEHAVENGIGDGIDVCGVTSENVMQKAEDDALLRHQHLEERENSGGTQKWECLIGID
jgi:hypothetical protein